MEFYPVNLFILLHGNVSKFASNSIISYSKQEVKASIDGGFNGLLNTTLEAVISMTDNKYKVGGKSVYNPNASYIGELFALNNGEEASVGTKWSYMSKTKYLQASIWGKIPKQSRMLAAIHHEIRDSVSVASLKVTQGIHPYILAQNKLKGESLSAWDLETTMASSIFFMPSFNLNVEYEGKESKNMHTALKFKPLDLEFEEMRRNKQAWILKLKNVDIEVSFTNGKFITGSGKYGDHALSVIGQLENTDSRLSLDMDFQCNQFDPIKIACGWKREAQSSSAMLQVSSESNNLVKVEVTKRADSDGKVSTHVFLDSGVTPKYEGTLDLDGQNNVYSLLATTDDMILLKIQLSYEVSVFFILVA